MTFEGRAANSVLQLSPLVALVAGIAAMILAPVWVIGLPIALSGIPMLMFSSLTLTIDSESLLIKFGPLGVPRVRVPTRDIEYVEMLHIRPMRYGGWGYRGGLRWFKKAAAVVRKGEGLRLQLTGGRFLIITVDNAREALAVIQSLTSRSTVAV